MNDDIRAKVDELMPQARADLETLVRIPSVSAAAFDQAHVQASAEWVAQALREVGMPQVEILRADRPDGTPGAPAVVARRPAPAGRPTVLLYAHHDVQPPGDAQLWSTGDPFEPEERNGRLYGRGAADDKAGILVHLTALRALLPAWGEADGVGIVVFAEGEEEIGSPSFGRFLEQYTDKLAADVIVVADSDNWALEVPSLTVTLRGLVDAVLTVFTLEHAVHSGMYGGAAPDATMVAIRVLNRLWDDDGAPALPGITQGQAAALDYPEATFRADAGLREGVSITGRGDLLSRIWNGASATVTGFDVPSVALSSNTLLGTVQAKVSLRVPPGVEPQQVFDAARTLLEADPPFGATVTLECRELGEGFQADVTHPVYAVAQQALQEAFGSDRVVLQGVGGSIPFIADFARVFPDACVLVTGVEDHDARAHGIDESLNLAVFQRAVLGHALLLDRLSTTMEATHG